MTTKVCTTCWATKPIAEFCRSRLNRCLDCERARDIARQRGKRNYAGRIKDPLKVKAQNAVRKAIRRGAMNRGSCEVCGLPKADAHHFKGYEPENWLVVKWLCHRHHMEEHQRKAS